MKNVSDIVRQNTELTKDYKDFGAYAIVLQNKYQNYSANLKKDIVALAAKSPNASFLMSKLTKVGQAIIEMNIFQLCPYLWGVVSIWSNVLIGGFVLNIPLIGL